MENYNPEFFKPEYLTVRMASAIYGISETAMRKLMLEPDFPDMLRIGRRIVIKYDQLKEYMEKKYMIPRF